MIFQFALPYNQRPTITYLYLLQFIVGLNIDIQWGNEFSLTIYIYYNPSEITVDPRKKTTKLHEGSFSPPWFSAHASSRKVFNRMVSLLICRALAIQETISERAMVQH